MMNIRRANERGHASHGWLDSYNTFSFADYYDPEHMCFRSLRVINQDVIASGAGFPTHPHRDMEIFSYILWGALAHKDSMGNGRTLLPGQIQLLSAGKGVTHSEFNPSKTEGASLLQIWIRPREHGLKPSYTELHPEPEHDSAEKVLVTPAMVAKTAPPSIKMPTSTACASPLANLPRMKSVLDAEPGSSSSKVPSPSTAPPSIPAMPPAPTTPAHDPHPPAKTPTPCSSTSPNSFPTIANNR